MKDVDFCFGNWQVSRAGNSLTNGAVVHRVEPRAMDVLVALCTNANTIVSSEQLLLQCWGSTLYGDNPVHKTITQLRRLLGDDAHAPRYIETIRKRGYRVIAEVVFDNSPAAMLVEGSWRDTSPFLGLQAFDADHAAVFFGRDDAIDALALALTKQVLALRSLLLVLGSSGSGKTSLIQAGLLPRLERQREADWGGVISSATLDLVELGDGQLFVGLAGAMLDWQTEGNPLFAGESAFSLGQRIEENLTAVIAALDAALGPMAIARHQKLLLFLDRFESSFTLPHISRQQRQQFIAAIDTLARSKNVVVILACRNDFYTQIAEFPALLEGKANGGHFDLTPPTAAEIAQIIRLPAKAANLTFGVDPQTQARLDDTLCQSAFASPDALPLLQYTLHELYRLRSSDGELSIEAYQRLGGLEGAIGSRADEVVDMLDEQHRAALPRILSLIVTLSADSDTATRRSAPYAALNSDAERELVNALVEARLFVSALVGSAAGFSIAHEALLRRWSRAIDWIATHRSSLRIRSRVAQSTARWVAEGQTADLLLPHGKQLDEARTLLTTTALSLSPDEMLLITASSRKALRRERLRLGVIILILALAVLATLFGVTAVNAKRSAQQRRDQAEHLMGFMLGDFADKLRPLARLDLLDSVSAKALEYLAGSADDDLNAVSMTHRAKALEVIGEVRISRGDPKGAIDALLAGNAILRQQLEITPKDTEVLKQIGANVFWLGQIQLNQNEWDQAHKYFSLYRDYSDRMSALEPLNIDAWIEQSYAHNNLGTLALRRGDAQTAEREFQASIALKSRAMAQKPEDLMLAADFADSLSWAGSTDEAIGDLAAAQALYERESIVIKALHQAAPNDLLWASKMAIALHHQAALKLSRGLDQSALNDYSQADEILNRIIHAAPGNREWEANMIIGQLEMLRITGNQHEAQTQLIPLSAVRKKIIDLTKLDPKNAEWTRLYALTMQRTASVLLGVGQLEEATQAINDVLLRLNELYVRNRMNINTRTLLANTFLIRAEIAHKRGNRNDAVTDCKAVITLLGTEASNSTNFKVLNPWIRSHRCIAEGDTVVATAVWMNQIGYREEAYLKYLSHYP
ncbi:nSTAND1 domain-containing NTPase [Glaciimonas sp. GG7]